MDGLDCIWLVNDQGEYEQTLDHEFLYRYFDIIQFAKHTNWHGHKRPRIPPIRPADLAVKASKPRARTGPQTNSARRKKLEAKS
jgi:hypothetical protein